MFLRGARRHCKCLEKIAIGDDDQLAQYLMGWDLGRRRIEENDLGRPRSRVGPRNVQTRACGVHGRSIFERGINLIERAGARVNLCLKYPSMLLLKTHDKFEETESLTVQQMD